MNFVVRLQEKMMNFFYLHKKNRTICQSVAKISLRESTQKFVNRSLGKIRELRKSVARRNHKFVNRSQKISNICESKVEKNRKICR